MSIEALKEQARRHEQKEEWQKALDQYQKAISKLEAEDQPDIGLYNRVGDLFVRVGRLQDAVDHYVKAVDLYMESELPNNAIAVCKKIIRNLPNRHDAYLRMGQIRAQQGFLPDARVNFLTYAERMQQAGDLDESFRALVEFCDLAPDDVGVRITVAEQMATHGRSAEAVGQLVVAYHAMMGRGEAVEASALEDKIREMDPDVDLSVVPETMPGAFMPGSGADDGGIVTTFGEIGGPAGVHEHEVDEVPGFETTAFQVPADEHDDEDEEAPDEEDEATHALEFGLADEDQEEEGEAEDLPLIDFATEEEDEEAEEAAELPLMDFATEEYGEDESEAVDLPLMDFATDDDEEGEIGVGADVESTSAEARRGGDGGSGGRGGARPGSRSDARRTPRPDHREPGRPRPSSAHGRDRVSVGRRGRAGRSLSRAGRGAAAGRPDGPREGRLPAGAAARSGERGREGGPGRGVRPDGAGRRRSPPTRSTWIWARWSWTTGRRRRPASSWLTRSPRATSRRTSPRCCPNSRRRSPRTWTRTT